MNGGPTSLGIMILQSRFDTQFVNQADTNTIVLAAIIIGIFVVILLVAGAANKRRGATGGGSSGSRKYTKGGFRRRGKQLGLSKAHITTLEFLRQKYQVKSPMVLLQNSRQLDFYLNKAVREIDEQVASEEVKEAQKLTLYRIKQIIERTGQKSASINSTKQLKPGQRISVTGENETRYESRIVAILKDGVVVEVPASEDGSQVRWKKWSPVLAHFWKSNGEGFSFQSKVAGYNTFKEVPSIFLQHSNRIQVAKQRKYCRKSIDSPCYFYPVKVMPVGTGRNAQKRAYVDKKRGMLGTIVEVSAGGCSIRATRTLPKGSLIKIDFETERAKSVSSYGKVVKVRKEEGLGTIMHVMFTKVSKLNLNRINSFIYEYGEAVFAR